MQCRIPRNRNDLTCIVNESISRCAAVEARIENALAKLATVILTDTAPGALAAAVAAAVDGAVIEVQTNAAYSPFVLPAGKMLVIRAGTGYGPRLTGSRCIQIANGAADHVVSGFSFESYTTPSPNDRGAGIDFEVRNAKATNCIFHNMNFGPVTAGSAVMLSYHWTDGPDFYYNPPQPAELSDTIAFVDCRSFRGGAEGIEGGALSLRAFAHPLFLRCQINGDGADSRGIQLQNCTDLLVKDCTVRGFGGGNGEGIKVDSIGTPVAVRESGLIMGNRVCSCVEGIDIDDDADIVVADNLCFDNVDEGVSIDGSGAPPVGAARCLCVGNVCFKNGKGILVEVGAVCELQFNSCFGNTTDYSILNGYALPPSNLTTPMNARRYPAAASVPYSPAVPANWTVQPVTVQEALDMLAAKVGPV